MSAGGGDASVEVTQRLEQPDLDAVLALVDGATEADGVPPLSEHVMLHLRYGGESPARQILLRLGDGKLAGYAHVDVTDAVAGPSAELVVDPALRSKGHGRRLVEAALRESPDGRLRLWAHGQRAPAAALARSMGFQQMRELWQMRRSLFAALPEAPTPPDVTVRTFVPGQDEEAWLALNRRAFAGHPEQGEWTAADLHRRMAEPWFDPEGFFLAERGGRLVGFHWTKLHAHDDSDGHEPIGEVYVLGVDPAEQGGGLGRSLAVVGLRWLRARRLPQAMLYVEADSAAAIRLYTSLGFTHWDTDRMFRRA